MAVDEEGCRAGLADESTEQLPRVHLDAGEGSARDTALAHDSVTGIESKAPELLEGECAEPRSEVRPHFGRGAESLSAPRSRADGAPAEFDRGLEHRRSDRADASGGVHDLALGGLGHAVETTKVREELHRWVD